MALELKMKGKVEISSSDKATWYLIILPKGKSRDLREYFSGLERGFGSLPVEVTIGKTTWRTSIFPESKNGAYLLLLKAEVRKKEGIKEGDTVSYVLKILI